MKDLVTSELVRYALVPLVWAFGIGVAAAMVALSVSMIVVAVTDIPLKAIPLATFGAGSLAGLASVLWFIVGKRGTQQMLYSAEVLLGVDINQDNVVGRPEPEPFTVEVREGRSLSYLNVATRAQWLSFVNRMVNGDGSTAEVSWCGAGKPFAKDEFVKFRNELMRRGHAEWVSKRHHAQGWRLTARGRRLMEASAKQLRLL